MKKQNVGLACMSNHPCRIHDSRDQQSNIASLLRLLCPWSREHRGGRYIIYIKSTKSTLSRVLPTLAGLLIYELTLSEWICASRHIYRQRIGCRWRESILCKGVGARLLRLQWLSRGKWLHRLLITHVKSWGWRRRLLQHRVGLCCTGIVLGERVC